MSAPLPSDRSRTGRVTIDRSRIEDRWRYVCPRGHCDWTPTHDHLWCTACARRRTRDGTDFDESKREETDSDEANRGARYDRVLDKMRGELLAYEDVSVD